MKWYDERCNGCEYLDGVFCNHTDWGYEDVKVIPGGYCPQTGEEARLKSSEIIIGRGSIWGPIGATELEEHKVQHAFYLDVKQKLGAVGIIGAGHNEKCWECKEESRNIVCDKRFGDMCYGKKNKNESCWPEGGEI